MRTILVGATFALALMLGAFGLFTLGQDTQAGGSSVDATGIDMDPTGNTSTSVGSVEQSLGNVALNTPTTIDIFVKGVPGNNTSQPYTGGLFGVGFELNYDPALVKITAVTATTTNSNVLQFSGLPASPLINNSDIDNNPGDDQDGALRVDSVGAGTGIQQEIGSGRVAAITLECIDTGVSDLTLTDTQTGGFDKAGVLFATQGGGTYTVDLETEAVIGCNTDVTEPTPGTITPGPTGTVTPAPTGTITPAPTGTVTPAPSGTVTPAPTGTVTPAPTGTVTPAPTGTVTPAPTGTVTPTETEPAGTTRLFGDLDCDGSITTRDNQGLLRKVLLQNALSQEPGCPLIGASVSINGTSRLFGDLDCDGAITTRDNQALLRKVLLQNALSQEPGCPLIGASVQVSG